MSGVGYLKNRALVPVRPPRPASWWWLALLVLPPAITAMLPDPPQTPAPRENFEIGVLPQDRVWLCRADGRPGCSARDYLSAYQLDGPAYRAAGELLQERIGASGSFDPGRALILNQKRKCPEGTAEQCRGQISGL